MTCEIQKRCVALFLMPSFYFNIFSLKHYGQVGGISGSMVFLHLIH